MAGDGEASGWLKGAVWALGLGLPIVVTGLGGWLLIARSDSLDRDATLSHRMDAIEERVNQLAEDMSAHERADKSETRLADVWRQRIISNEQRLNAIMAEVAHCTSFKERCAALERRMDRLEENIEKVTSKVAELDAGVRALGSGRHR